MTPTGSWPMTSPGRTGYSPLRMWTSVPQIVVVVTRMTASPAPARGFGTASTRMSFGPWKTVARMVSVPRFAGRGVSTIRVMAALQVWRTGRRRECCMSWFSACSMNPLCRWVRPAGRAIGHHDPGTSRPIRPHEIKERNSKVYARAPGGRTPASRRRRCTTIETAQPIGVSIDAGSPFATAMRPGPIDVGESSSRSAPARRGSAARTAPRTRCRPRRRST